ncbi:hypothetical protein CGZ80_14800 [Rhodopirellula sp. MGV]|nr:hypothetical protein CGZ80_14800 [Rhodopirellula sp. MGV]
MVHRSRRVEFVSDIKSIAVTTDVPRTDMRQDRKTSTLGILTAAILLAWSAYAAHRVLQNRVANSNVSHRMHGDPQSESYPFVLSHSICDWRGKVRIVLLHRFTHPVNTANGLPFHWLDRLAIDRDGSKLDELRIRGQLVWVDPSCTQFFLATDDQILCTSKQIGDSGSAFTSADEAWGIATSLSSVSIWEP